MYSVLDNPIWNALNTTDNDKNIGHKNFAFFDAEIAPFIGMPLWDEANQKELFKHVPNNRSWFLLIGSEVDFINEIDIVFSLPLYQLICFNPSKAPLPKKEIDIVPLNKSHVDEMIALTQLTKPGPFTKRTIEFGGYYGMFEKGKLVAMGGERLHVDRYTEISAICTHPDYQGLGYAAKITHYLASNVIRKGHTPFLHVRTDNVKAIDVYKRLGFEIRTKIYFYILKKL
ncbi:GNAT family N-acetyltransferase [Gaetbulibacter sp. M235]|uniref:GNAT family N-acetyltransferase n=1 Tax=Gaetbulibacter sp. M235 TaxID=3126510 RepID=UPI00374E9F23